MSRALIRRGLFTSTPSERGYAMIQSSEEARRARRFVPADADLGDWSAVEPLFDGLDARPIDTAEALEAWLLDVSELADCFGEEVGRRYVAMTCDTADADREAAYLHVVEQLTPKYTERTHRLRERYVASPARQQLDQARYRVLDRQITTDVKLFREENIPLDTEDTKLGQQYQKTCGAQTVTHDGTERTLQQMARYLKEPDRGVRQEAWEKTVARRLEDREAFDEIFGKLIALRTSIARNAGFDNFRDYQHQAYHRFDYGPEACFEFHDATEKLVVPLRRRLQQQRREELGVDRLRPWDLSVDPKGRPALKPFEDVGTFCQGCKRIFERLDSELAAQFESMIDAGELDLESRKGKAPGGYQYTFPERRRPFIFMNAVGLHNDVMTLVHEAGHAFHTLASAHEPLHAYRDAGMEICEVASMGMEMLALDHLDVFYEGDDLARARRENIEDVVNTFPWIATIDAFQQWLYTHPEHSREERTDVWLGLLERFGGIEDYEGYEDARRAMWQRQLHLFLVPFYYIEYGISQVGALQLWQNARRETGTALRRYRQALALGASRPIPELWQTAGLDFRFNEATLQPLVQAIEAELQQ